MAKTARGDANSKEKTGASPSNPQLKKSNKSPSSSSSSVCKTNFTSSEKSVPNYLKPTLSSRRDSFSSSKSPSADFFAQKSAVDRRRSFDKLPSTLHLQKSFQGPGSSESQRKPVRSTSFTSSTRNTPFSSRPTSERLSKTPMEDAKTVVSHLSKGNSMKKNTTIIVAVKKENVGSSLKKKKAPKSGMPESSTEDHCRDGVLLLPGNEQQLGDLSAETILKNADEEKEENVKHANIVSYQVHEDADKGEAAQQSQSQRGHGADYHSKEEVISKYGGGGGGTGEELSEHEVLEENVPEGVENGDEGELKDEVTAIDRKQKEFVGKERRPEGGQVIGSARQQQHPVSRGKKETRVYNDVIEETASKLLQNKKNKVRALAGAFETVISLQTHQNGGE